MWPPRTLHVDRVTPFSRAQPRDTKEYLLKNLHFYRSPTLTSNDPGLDFLGSFVTRHPTTSRITVVAVAGVGDALVLPLSPPLFSPAAAPPALPTLGNRSTIGGAAGTAVL